MAIWLDSPLDFLFVLGYEEKNKEPRCQLFFRIGGKGTWGFLSIASLFFLGGGFLL